MEMNFCRRCGSPLVSTAPYTYKCSSGHLIYANPVPSVGIFFLTSDNQVLLSVRGIEPNKGMLDAFGGFLDGEETAKEAAERELREELSLRPEDYEPLRYLTSALGHTIFKDESIPILSIFFWSRLKTTRSLVPSDDVSEIYTVPLAEVDLKMLHDDDIRVGIETLKQLVVTPEQIGVKTSD